MCFSPSVFFCYILLDYETYIATLNLGDVLPEGTTVTFVDPSVLGETSILSSNCLESRSNCIQPPPSAVNVDHVFPDQSRIIFNNVSGINSSISGFSSTHCHSDTLALPTAAGPVSLVLAEQSMSVVVKPPVGKVYIPLLLSMTTM